MTSVDATDPLSAAECLDRLEALVRSGGSVFGFARRSARVDEARRLLGYLRELLADDAPRVARRQAEAEAVLKRAQDEARRIVLEAQEHARAAADEEIVRRAEHRGREIHEQAARDAGEVRREADAYALGVLQGLEAEMSRILATVRRGQAILGERTGGGGAPSRPSAESRQGAREAGASRAEPSAAAARLDNEKLASL